MKDVFRLVFRSPKELSEAQRLGRRHTIVGLVTTGGVLAVGGAGGWYALHGGFEQKPEPLPNDYSGEVSETKDALEMLDSQIQGYPDRMKASYGQIYKLATAYYSTQMKVDREEIRKKVVLSEPAEMAKLAQGCGVFNPGSIEYVDIVGNRVMINQEVVPASGTLAKNVFSQYLADSCFADFTWKNFSQPQRAEGSNLAIFYQKGIAVFGKELNSIGPAQAAECFNALNNELNSAIAYDATDRMYELLGYGALVLSKNTVAYRQYFVDGLYDGNWTTLFNLARQGQLNSFFNSMDAQLSKKQVSTTATDYVKKYITSS